MRQTEIEKSHCDYMALAGEFLARARGTRVMLHIGCSLLAVILAELDAHIVDGERQIDQVRRRFLNGRLVAKSEAV